MKHFSRLHWFQFCPTDWITLCSLKGLTIPAQGVFLRLLCLQWLEGDITVDPLVISKAINYSGEGFHEALALFRPHPTRARRQWYAPLEDLRQDAAIYHRKKSDAGRRSAEVRALKAMRNNPTQSHDLSDN